MWGAGRCGQDAPAGPRRAVDNLRNLKSERVHPDPTSSRKVVNCLGPEPPFGIWEMPQCNVAQVGPGGLQFGHQPVAHDPALDREAMLDFGGGGGKCRSRHRRLVGPCAGGKGTDATEHVWTIVLKADSSSKV